MEFIIHILCTSFHSLHELSIFINSKLSDIVGQYLLATSFQKVIMEFTNTDNSLVKYSTILNLIFFERPFLNFYVNQIWPFKF